MIKSHFLQIKHKAYADGQRYFFIKKPNPEECLDVALDEFKRFNYATVWYLYRYFFNRGFLDKRQEYAIMKEYNRFYSKRFRNG